jgi:hypothetical protein
MLRSPLQIPIAVPSASRLNGEAEESQSQALNNPAAANAPD